MWLLDLGFEVTVDSNFSQRSLMEAPELILGADFDIWWTDTTVVNFKGFVVFFLECKTIIDQWIAIDNTVIINIVPIVVIMSYLCDLWGS